jgi:hypothetical protein
MAAQNKIVNSTKGFIIRNPSKTTATMGQMYKNLIVPIG